MKITKVFRANNFIPKQKVPTYEKKNYLKKVILNFIRFLAQLFTFSESRQMAHVAKLLHEIKNLTAKL